MVISTWIATGFHMLNFHDWLLYVWKLYKVSNLTRAGEQSAIWPSTIFSTFWTSYFSYKPSINFHETWGISRSGYDLEVSRKKKGKIIIQSWEKCCPKWLFFLGHVFPPHGLKHQKTWWNHFILPSSLCSTTQYSKNTHGLSPFTCVFYNSHLNQLVLSRLLVWDVLLLRVLLRAQLQRV